MSRAMFGGFIDEGAAATLIFQVTAAGDDPVEPSSAPTWRLYGANGLVAAGAGNAASFETGSITGATNATPIVLTTSAPHGLSVGQTVTIGGVGGNTNANGDYPVATVPSSTTFTIGRSGNGAYTSGGTWRTTGLYKVALSGSVLNSLEAGKTYVLVVSVPIEGTPVMHVITFTVR